MPGRVSKYESHVKPKLELITGWARDGVTDEQIAHNLGVAYSTFREYKQAQPALAAALKDGKEVADLKVVGALYRRAMGYAYDEVTREQRADPESGERRLTVTKVVTKQVAPDVTAQIFWLKNRLPAQWRDKPVEAEAEGGDNGVVLLPEVIPDE